MRALCFVLLALASCGPQVRDLQVVSALPESCLPGRLVTQVRFDALGDFPPGANTTALATTTGSAQLVLPQGTRVVTVEGIGDSGLEAFGRSAPADEGVFGAKVAVAYGPPDWLCATGSLHFDRTQHHATRLASGDVIITGGVNADGPVASVERYVPAGDATGPAGFRLLDPKTTQLDLAAILGHAVTALATGDALVTGGVRSMDGQPFDIASDGMMHLDASGAMDQPIRLLRGGARAFHSATALPDGRVVLVGGCERFDASGCASGSVLNTSVIFDPKASTFVDGPTLLHPRWNHQAILRGDGSLLMVGGRDAMGAEPPLEVFAVDGAPGIEGGPGHGQAALLPTGAIALIGGDQLATDAADLWLGPGEGTARLPLLPQERSGHSLTALEDGSLLIAGGGIQAPLVNLAPTGESVPLLPTFGRTGHTATLLDDGTVLLAGGIDDSGMISHEALVYLHSPIGPYATLPTLSFDTSDALYVPRRPDRVNAASGQMEISAPSGGAGGRPSELALLAGMELSDFALELLAGRTGTAGVALILGWQSEVAYAFVTIDPGQPVALFTVTSSGAGQSMVDPVVDCQGAVLDETELPDGPLAELQLSWRAGKLEVSSTTRKLLTCVPATTLIGRGRVGVGALRGVVQFDNITVTR